MKTSTATLALLLSTFVGTAAAIDPPRPPDKIREVKAGPSALAIVTSLPKSIAVPNGSYLATCQNVKVDLDVLSASCKNRDGELRGTSISASGCNGVDISNNNGRLLCVTPVRAHWGGNVLPPGSYLDSCYAVVEGTTLRAGCRTGDGGSSVLGLEMSREGVRQNRMDLTRCPDGSEIANLRGDLTCVAR